MLNELLLSSLVLKNNMNSKINDRVCSTSRYCGGCQLQGVSYSKQLEAKQKYIDNLFKKYIKPKKIISMNNPYNYRNKMQVSFGIDNNKGTVFGNYVTSTHTIVPINECMICNEDSLSIIKSINKLIEKYKISIFNENSLKGCLRHILIRNTNKNEFMVILITGSSYIKNKELFIKDIIKYNKNVKTIIQNVNNKHTSMVLGLRNIVLYGKGYIIDRLCGLSFKISPSSFYQVNSRQTEVLYNTAIKLANLKRSDYLIDAYCGTGTIGIVASKHCKEVLGIELNKMAIKDASDNMRLNNISNISFINDDASKYMSFLARKKIHVDVVIMDPPRTGSDKKFINALFKIKPSRVVYISCNPETLKNDLSDLKKYYRISLIQPVDMFPFTNHIECITLLEYKYVN